MDVYRNNIRSNMWDLNGIEGSSAEVDSSYTCGIQILLVDHDDPHNTSHLLHQCYYKGIFIYRNLISKGSANVTQLQLNQQYLIPKHHTENLHQIFQHQNRTDNNLRS